MSIEPESMKIFGAPGTGKTTRLINIVLEELGNGLSVEEIGYIGFTNAACNEARSRASNIAEFDGKKYWFQTIHASALKLLMNMRVLYGKNLALWKHQKEFCMQVGLDPPTGEDDAIAGGYMSSGSAFFSTQSYLINTFQDNPKACPHSEFLPKHLSYEYLVDEWVEFKTKNKLYDFNDILLRVYEEDLMLPTKVLIVDEFQDVSPLQKAIIENFAFGKERLYLAGDDDQAIYGFQGADSTLMLDYKVDRTEVLAHSYRCPSAIWEPSMELIERNLRRQEKKVTPRDNGGGFTVTDGSKIYDIGRLLNMTTGSSVFLLARTNSFVSKIAWQMAKGAELFRHLDSRKEKNWGWGSKKKVNFMNKVAEALYPIDYFDKTAYRAGFKKYTIDFLRLYARSRQKIVPTNIKKFIGTIHSAKGKEADTVILFNDISPLIVRGMEMDMEAERRVWYVGMTRARERLIVVDGFFNNKPYAQNPGLVYRMF